MHFNVKEDIIQLTDKWTGERFEDGRPRVPDEDIEKLRTMTLEECWFPLFQAGYKNQFESHLNRLRTNIKLVGRAVTCAYVPSRPDLFDKVEEIGHSEGRRGTHNLWVVDSLTEGDVIVCDFYDKIYEGTFVGGNLSTAIRNRTKTGGAVIWGGIRDVEQIEKIDGIQIYYRGIDPTPIKDSAEKSHCKDLFGFEMIKQGVYQTADIDIDYWPKSVLDRLAEFIRTDPRAAQYRDLDWTEEYEEARKFYGE